MKRREYPWARVSSRARKFAEEYASLYMSAGSHPHGSQKLKEYIQGAWQSGFESGRVVQRMLAKKK